MDPGNPLIFEVDDIQFRGDAFIHKPGDVIRWRRDSNALDTLAVLPVVNHARRSSTGYTPFVFRSAWALAPDGFSQNRLYTVARH